MATVLTPDAKPVSDPTLNNDHLPGLTRIRVAEVAASATFWTGLANLSVKFLNKPFENFRINSDVSLNVGAVAAGLVVLLALNGNSELRGLKNRPAMLGLAVAGGLIVLRNFDSIVEVSKKLLGQ